MRSDLFDDMTDDDLRREVLAIRDAHTPTNQGADAWPDRCALCHYGRHPCDTFEMADIALRLLDRGRTDADDT